MSRQGRIVAEQWCGGVVIFQGEMLMLMMGIVEGESIVDWVVIVGRVHVEVIAVAQVGISGVGMVMRGSGRH